MVVKLNHPPLLSLRRAKLEDAKQIVDLVNSAYRGTAGARGWTHEADIVAGSRTNTNEITAILEDSNSVILIGELNNAMEACVHLHKSGDDIHLGMLAVNPHLQGNGIGKSFLKQIESYCKQNMQGKSIILTVVSQRLELVEYYERRGYQRTGNFDAYPSDQKVGTPIVRELTVETMIKNLS
ncbi:GNAT family N-acetyltransferase [Kaarinaea lacus]